MIPHCFNNVEVWALGRIHASIRPVATDYSPLLVSFGTPQPFSPASLSYEWLLDSHSSMETISDGVRCISQIWSHVFAESFPYFFTSRHCSSAADSFVGLSLLSSSTCPVSWNFLETNFQPCWNIIELQTKSSLGMSLLLQNTILPIKMLSLDLFRDATKWTNYVSLWQADDNRMPKDTI